MGRFGTCLIQNSLRQKQYRLATIFILGLGLELERQACVGSEASVSVFTSKSSSLQSIFGFGHDDNLKWTYAGRKPLPIEDPAVGDDDENDTKEKDEAK